MGDIFSGLANMRDALFHKQKATLGFCTPDLEQTKGLLDRADQLVRRAGQVASFVNATPDVPDQLRKAATAIGKVREGTEKLAKGAHDIGAACQIADAIAVLNQWVASKKTDAEAAVAFDKLFGGVANFAAKLPPPTNSYAKILSAISLAGFFATMNRLGDSRAGLNTSTPTGAQLKMIDDELERQAGR